MLAVLPVSLLALLFASPVFAAEQQPTSTSDPFRALALRAPKQPDNPVCCLKPLSTPEPVDDGILLSFEEWKLRQLASEALSAPGKSDERNASDGAFDDHRVDERYLAPSSGGSTDSPTPPDDTTAPSLHPPNSGPQFRVPLTDRFNYASLDCSARVHTAHRSAKSPASILSSKKDRYMLSPCDKSKEKQFVVVELCDDIRIDTVQLANFEFFSGVFKDFTVSVSKTYTTDPDDWTLVSTYRAKNVRGVQSFRWPTSLRDFYRFIRIDFLSHYGNEYYCPVSLLRVYGLTHLEEWKWDVWESESRTKQAELQRSRMLTLPAEASPDAPSPAVIVVSSDADTQNPPPLSPSSFENTPAPSQIPNQKAFIAEHSSFESQPSTLSSDPISHASHTSTETQIKHHSTDTYVSSSPSSSSLSIVPQNTNIPSPSPSISEPPTTSVLSTPSIQVPVASSASASSSPSIPASSSQLSDPSASPSPSISAASSPRSDSGTPTPTIIIPSSSIAASASSTVVPVISAPPLPSQPVPPQHAQPPPPPPPPPPHSSPPLISPSYKQPSSSGSSSGGSGGESIYRTILNKLAEVELNQTLYMRYIAQQNGAVREVMRRLGEDVGRLEGINRAQSMTYQRTMDDWARQRYQLEMEYGELISRIEYLSEEITLEKRLGVAQLLLLLAVLVFLGLTRGSRAETAALAEQSGLGVREWSRRHLSLSGDWDWDWRRRFGSKDLGAGGAAKVDRGGSESENSSRSRSRTRTVTATVGPRTPSPPRVVGDGGEKKPKSGRHYPPHLPLHFGPYDDSDETILFPSTSQPYVSKSERERERSKRQRPLESISLNTGPISFTRSETRNATTATSSSRQRTTSNPRSRAPSLRSTPRRTHQYQYMRPVTPTSSATFLHQQLRPQLLQRSSSHGMGVGMLPSASWGSGSVNANVPKSAKKWARTAHLHEVKVVPPLRNKKSEEGQEERKGKERQKETTPRVFEFDRNGDGDMFSSSPSSATLTSEVYEKEDSAALRQPPAPTLPSDSLLFKSGESGVDEDGDGDGETWVDTDSVGGSELDVDVEVDENESRLKDVSGRSSKARSSSSSPRDRFVSPDLKAPPLIRFPSS